MSRQIDPRTGAALIAELEEFAGFSVETQRYIRRSLDVASRRPDPVERWARSQDEAEDILAQVEAYRVIDDIRANVPATPGRLNATRFYVPLLELSCFDLSGGLLSGFDSYEFLYERLLGAAIRPWLVSSYGAAAATPAMDPRLSTMLLAAAERDIHNNCSSREPTFYPEWIGNEVIEILG